MIGVHRPASRKIPPKAAAKHVARAIGSGNLAERSEIAMKIRWPLRPTLSNSNPRPGQLSGKVENRRCRVHPLVYGKEFLPALDTL
jgi:hypothetical protein